MTEENRAKAAGRNQQALLLPLRTFRSNLQIREKKKKNNLRKLFIGEEKRIALGLGGPVVKTLGSYCKGPGFDPWLGN